MATVIVAEDPTGELVGAMLAAPPFEWFAEVREADVSPLRSSMVMMAGAAMLVKLRSLAVDESARGAGIGAALVTDCTNLYFELGYRLAFGQIRLGSGLETYYPKLGFKVLAEREAIRVDTLLRLPNAEMGIAPPPGAIDRPLALNPENLPRRALARARLQAFHRLGYFPTAEEIPTHVADHVHRSLGLPTMC